MTSLPSQFRHTLSPRFLHRHHLYLHALRVAAAYACSLLLSLAFSIPHGEWMAITVFVVMGGLPHVGSVLNKGRQRALGTLAGSVAGMISIALYARSPLLCYLFMTLVALFSGYFALGRDGYIAQLAGITLAVVAGLGDSPLDMALWRSGNVFAGVALSMLFARLLPLRATDNWKYLLADNLHDCAGLFDRIARLENEHLYQDVFDRLNRRLVQQRSLMAAMRKEIDVDAGELEQLHRTQRGIISTLEQMDLVSRGSQHQDELERMRQQFAGEQVEAMSILELLSQALGNDWPDVLDQIEAMPFTRHEAGGDGDEVTRSFDAQGYYWMNVQLLHQVWRLHGLVRRNMECWRSAPAA
jgi:uncharacterized membrane protein YccC